jgi:hypothetical protein
MRVLVEDLTQDQFVSFKSIFILFKLKINSGKRNDHILPLQRFANLVQQ